jgi:hypothetical protein
MAQMNPKYQATIAKVTQISKLKLMTKSLGASTKIAHTKYGKSVNFLLLLQYDFAVKVELP